MTFFATLLTLLAVTPCAPSRAAAEVMRSGSCFVGTDRADVIVGTPAGDVVYGWGERDRISGGAGDDRLFAGAGDDVVRGGAGNDVIDPALGRDRVDGDDGDDVIKTRGGERDWISCGAGLDVVFADRLDVVARDCEKISRARGY